MTTPPVDLLLSKLKGVRRCGDGWSACCPAHDDRTPSLSINVGDDGRALVHCHTGCSFDDITRSLGIAAADLMMPREDGQQSPTCPPSGGGHLGKPRATSGRKSRVFATAEEAVAELEEGRGPAVGRWTYTNLKGDAVGVVLRWDRAEGGKDFLPVSRSGAEWVLKGMPEPRPLYALHHIVQQSRVYVCEGEKCAEAAMALGLTATTSANGAKSQAKSDWSALAGKDIVFLPDNDKAGERYVADIIQILKGFTQRTSVRVVRLPGLPEGGDLVDFVVMRGGEAAAVLAELESLRAAAEVIECGGPQGSRRVVSVCLADVKPEQISWLWPGWIARGKLTLVAGDPGLGKSFVTLDLAAKTTRAAPWPDGGAPLTAPASVLLLSAEDGVADTILPRLAAAGADLTRIRVLEAVKYQDPATKQESESAFDLSRDLVLLEHELDRLPDCALVVIDPISAYLGKTDSHKNGEIRGLLAPLSLMAARRNVAIVMVSHLNKNASSAAIYRTMGSLAFAAAARAAFAVVADKSDPARRLMLPMKNNLAKDFGGLAYRLSEAPENEQPTVQWEEGLVMVSANEALAPDPTVKIRDEAKQWLQGLLADGPIESAKVFETGEEVGFKEKTLRRAFRDLGGRPRKSGFQGAWTWELTGGVPKEATASPAEQPLLMPDPTPPQESANYWKKGA